MVSSVTRFFEKSRNRPAPSAVIRSPRPGSSANSVRRCTSRISSKWPCSAFQAARWVSGVTVVDTSDVLYVARATFTGSSRAAARSMISSSGPSARRLAGTPGSGPDRTPATALAFASPTARISRPAGGSQDVERQADAVGRRLGRVVHRDAYLAPHVQRRGVGKERRGVPVLAEAQKREIELRDAVRSRGDALADLARVGALRPPPPSRRSEPRGRRLRCAPGASRPAGGSSTPGRPAAPGARRRATARPPPSRRPGWPAARRWRGAWRLPRATGAPRGPGPGRRRSPRPVARPARSVACGGVSVTVTAGHRGYGAAFSAWPPNCLRIADSTLSAKSSRPREAKRE